MTKIKLQPGDYVSTESMTDEHYHAVCRAFMDAGAEVGEYGSYDKDTCENWGWRNGCGLYAFMGEDKETYGFTRELTLQQILVQEEKKMTKITVFGQEERHEKKCIEFVRQLHNSDSIGWPTCAPKDFTNVHLMGSFDNELDLIIAWNDGRPYKQVFLGHWNDGVV